MAKSTPTYTLKFDKSEDCWNTFNAKGKEVGCYMSKAEGMSAKEIKKVVGKAGGVVRIMGKNGKKTGERSYKAR